MNCTRCDGTGFLNAGQIPEHIWDEGPETILRWLGNVGGDKIDATVCDCCGNGEDGWYGEPGQHYGPDDPPGPNGPYAYNGGLCECH